MSNAIAENVSSNVVIDPHGNVLEAAPELTESQWAEMEAFEEKLRADHPDWDDDQIVEASIEFEKSIHARNVVPVPIEKPDGKPKPTRAVKPVDPAEVARKEAATARMNALKAARTKVANSYARLHEASKLDVYVGIGNDVKEAVLLAKADVDLTAAERKAASPWTDTDVDRQIALNSLEIKVLYPHIFVKAAEEEGRKNATKANKGIEMHLSDYVWTAIAHDLCKDIIGENISGVSYHIMVNFVVRKLVLKSKIDLTGKIRDGWTGFLQTHLDKLARGQITHGEFIAEMTAHEVKLAEARKAEANSGLTADQIAAKEKAAELAAKQAKDSKRKGNINESLTSSLASALKDDGLNRGLIGSILMSQLAESKVSLADLGLEPNHAVNPKTCSADEVIDLIRAVFMAKRGDVFRDIITECVQMEAMLPKAKPTLSVAV
jgi:hypothetical protein